MTHDRRNYIYRRLRCIYHVSVPYLLIPDRTVADEFARRRSYTLVTGTSAEQAQAGLKMSFNIQAVE
jgi:hypothetical protein